MLPFADASIDRIAADSVLEHVAHPHNVIRECWRVLRPGGVMRLATPFVFNLHGYPDDYLRYTPSFYERACREAGFAWVATDVEAARGLYYTLHNSAKTAVVEPDRPGADALRLLHLLTIEWLAALVPLDNDFNNGARHWFHSVQVVAVKGGDYVPSRRARQWDRPFVPRALDLLACPISRRPLRVEGDRLLCDASGFRYPVRDGIPIFTEPRRLGRRHVPARARKLRERGQAAVAAGLGRPGWTLPVRPV